MKTVLFKGKPVERGRSIRDEVRARVAELVSREGWACVRTVENVGDDRR
ncbi:hypothetical protein [Sorangium sp. So ce1335]